jgi:ketosteroid isomerase-like protein
MSRRAILAVAGGAALLGGPGQARASGHGGRSVRTVRRFYELLRRKDVDAFGELWHERARLIVPYPSEGFPSLTEGKAEIVAGFRNLLPVFESLDFTLTAIYPVAGSDTVCVEYKTRGVLVDGVVYTNDNIVVFLFEDGLISAYHDYFDPRRFQVVVDRLPRD